VPLCAVFREGGDVEVEAFVGANQEDRSAGEEYVCGASARGVGDPA